MPLADITARGILVIIDVLQFNYEDDLWLDVNS